MKNRKTSIEAYKSIPLESKQAMWSRIVKTLKRNRAGLNYSEIAEKIGVEPVQVARRLNELVEAGIVINSPLVRKTKTGRPAMVRVISKKYAA